MQAIPSFFQNYLYGMSTFPLTLATSTTTSLIGQAVGLSTMSLPQRLYRGFQTESYARVEAIYPTSSQWSRIAFHILRTFTCNQRDPFLEEVACRWLLQDKILTWLIPLDSGLSSLISKQTYTIARIAITSFLFASPHFKQAIKQGRHARHSTKKAMENATFAFFSTMGNSLAYGYVYEKGGLAASFGAHAAWNMFYDLWFLNHWKIKSSPQPLSRRAPRSLPSNLVDSSCRSRWQHRVARERAKARGASSNKLL